MSDSDQTVGVVVIGRNEGKRLENSLHSINPSSLPVVYVDSGSTDQSVSFARSLGCEVIELDLSIPFTAARARNEGYRRLSLSFPSIKYVQFIDGDCELNQEWISVAAEALDQEPKLAIVCGRRREKYPDASIFNRLIDIEWDTPIGETDACGGDALARLSALQDVAGYDEDFAAGEEPEMCFRMRRRSWQIRRIDAEMTLHDAELTQWKQWWTRSKRSGSAYAQGAWTHGWSAERYKVRDCARIWFWGGILPAGVLLTSPATGGWSLWGGVGAYGLLLLKMQKYRRNLNDSPSDALAFSAFNLLGKFPQLVGQISFLRQRRSKLIEYKSTPT